MSETAVNLLSLEVDRRSSLIAVIGWLSETERIFLRTVEVEPCLELLGDEVEVEEGQT